MATRGGDMAEPRQGGEARLWPQASRAIQHGESDLGAEEGSRLQEELQIRLSSVKQEV